MDKYRPHNITRVKQYIQPFIPHVLAYRTSDITISARSLKRFLNEQYLQTHDLDIITKQK